MKKFVKSLFIIFALFATVVLAACGDSGEGDEKGDDPKYEYNTQYTDNLKLTEDYTNKSFVNEGIGIVTLSQAVDGDTAHFIDKKSGERFTARFLCINTPESTGRIDPWGKAASNFVANILKSATLIVCEAEIIGKPAEYDTTHQRLLSYVWYRLSENDDLRLLNLEIVEEGYSKFTDVSTEVKYGSIFQQAHLKSYALKIKDYGEKDPNFDYTGEVLEVTIAEVKANISLYNNGSKLKITARVMRLIGDNIYLQDLTATDYEDKGLVYGSIYMFSGYGSGLGSLKVGEVITFNCQCVINETYGTQLTNPTKVKRVTNTDGYTISVLDGSSQIDLATYEGFVVTIPQLTVINVNNPDEEGAFTIYCKTASGQSVNVRIDGSAYPKLDYTSIEVGKTYDVTGGISKFNDTFQIMLGNQKDAALNDFILTK